MKNLPPRGRALKNVYPPLKKPAQVVSNELSISNRAVITSFPGHTEEQLIPPELKGRGTLLLLLSYYY